MLVADIQLLMVEGFLFVCLFVLVIACLSVVLAFVKQDGGRKMRGGR